MIFCNYKKLAVLVLKPCQERENIHEKVTSSEDRSGDL